MLRIELRGDELYCDDRSGDAGTSVKRLTSGTLSLLQEWAGRYDAVRDRGWVGTKAGPRYPCEKHSPEAASGGSPTSASRLVDADGGGLLAALTVLRLNGHNAETWDKPNITAAERFLNLYSEDELRGWVGRCGTLLRRAPESWGESTHARQESPRIGVILLIPCGGQPRTNGYGRSDVADSLFKNGRISITATETI